MDHDHRIKYWLRLSAWCLDILCSALLTLPALENVSFEQLDHLGPGSIEEGQSLEKHGQSIRS
jgi:hypothetical protein